MRENTKTRPISDRIRKLMEKFQPENNHQNPRQEKKPEESLLVTAFSKAVEILEDPLVGAKSKDPVKPDSKEPNTVTRILGCHTFGAKLSPLPKPSKPEEKGEETPVPISDEIVEKKVETKNMEEKMEILKLMNDRISKTNLNIGDLEIEISTLQKKELTEEKREELTRKEKELTEEREKLARLGREQKELAEKFTKDPQLSLRGYPIIGGEFNMRGFEFEERKTVLSAAKKKDGKTSVPSDSSNIRLEQDEKQALHGNHLTLSKEGQVKIKKFLKESLKSSPLTDQEISQDNLESQREQVIQKILEVGDYSDKTKEEFTKILKEIFNEKGHYSLARLQESQIKQIRSEIQRYCEPMVLLPEASDQSVLGSKKTKSEKIEELTLSIYNIMTEITNIETLLEKKKLEKKSLEDKRLALLPQPPLPSPPLMETRRPISYTQMIREERGKSLGTKFNSPKDIHPLVPTRIMKPVPSKPQKNYQAF